MSKECKQARNVVMITFVIVMAIIFLVMTSCNNKNVSAHGQESDYHHELMVDRINYQQAEDCCNCDEID